GDDLILKDYVHVGFAVDTPRGLLVPVVRDCDRKGLVEIAREMGELAEQARTGTLPPAAMQGGGFSVSSLGGIGGDGFTPIINAPEVAILGAARSRIEPVWDGSTFQPRLILPLSLSWDHRAVDGAAAARFLSHLAAVLTDLRRGAL
ncbi:branched-chain alpha-keto acid dehydrogenase subunit E2, partial [Methylobacterium indicum]